MASISYYLDTRKPLADGTYPLKLRVSHKNSAFFLHLNVHVRPEQWNSEIKEVVSHPRKSTFNPHIQREFVRVQDQLLDLNKAGLLKKLTATELKNKFMGSQKTDQRFFAKYANDFINSRREDGTKAVYRHTLNAIGLFADLDSLEFADINPAWLRSFESHLANKDNSVNTRSIHLRNIRAIFNAAINDKIIGLELYPFRGYKINSEETESRALLVEDLRILRDYPCEDWQEEKRDLFMLIFYMIGINSIDLYKAQPTGGDRLGYRRSKTHRLYNVKIEPEAQEILDKYKGETKLLALAERYSDHKGFRKKINDALKVIGPSELVMNSGQTSPKMNKKQRHPIFPRLSTYWARHSWATIAGDLEIPKETIAAALGHGKKTTTDIYIDFNRKKIDEANRKVIDYVNSACGWFRKQ